MDYAGFWIRLGARLIDLLVMLPVALLCQWLLQTIGPAWLVPYGFVLFIYFPYFHATAGQTPGKRMTGLKVVMSDGSPLGWSGAILRSAVDGVCTAAWCIALYVAIKNASSQQGQLAHVHGYIKALEPYMPHWSRTFQISFGMWTIVDVASLLFSRHKRSLHDLIAGTVVIRRIDVTRNHADAPEGGSRPADAGLE